MKKLVFIIGESTDDEVVALVSHLKGCDIVYFNEETQSDFTILGFPAFKAPEIYCCDQQLLPDAVFWRNLDFDVFGFQHDPTNCDAYIELFTNAFPHALWLNPPRAFRQHHTKIKQMRTVLRTGVEMPPTIMTNDAGVAAAFLDEIGPVAVKPIAGGDYTLKFKKKKRLKRYVAKQAMPVCIQKFIEGPSVRTFVIGDKVYSSIIFSDGPDFRIDNEAEYYPIDVPKWLKQQAVEITADLGMHWTAIDWIFADDKYYFLEANFSPMFANYQELLDQPIAETIAGYILDTI